MDLMKDQPKIICTTLLVETSPQAMPLGAACIASAIKADSKTKGRFQVLLQDFSLEDEGMDRNRPDSVAKVIAEKLVRQNPKALCFSVFVWNHQILEAAAREAKRLLPSVLTLAGGPEVTANPTAFSGFDYTIAGQGEGAVPELLERLFLHEDDRPIPGVYALGGGTEGPKNDGPTGAPGEGPQAGAPSPATPVDPKNGSPSAATTPSSPTRALPCLPENLSSPYLDGTLDPERYGGALWELARGCPFKCSYCYESKGEKKIAYFPLERLEKEIELFHRKNIPQVWVLDPTYNASKERAISMLKIIAKKAPGTFFNFEARAEFIDRQLAQAFSTIPCALQIGLQSADPQVLAKVHRTLDKKKFIKNIGYLNEAGVVFGFDLIFGLPGDTYPGFCSSIDFALSLYPNNLELFCLSVLPGTTLHDDAAGYGMKWENHPPYHVLSTPQFSAKDLGRAQKLALATNLFYTQGRAVPWFNSVLYPLHQRPSTFLESFTSFLDGQKASSTQTTAAGCAPSFTDLEIERLQLEFVRKSYRQKGLDKLLLVAEDLILMNGAIGRATADGSESHIQLHYHPDDIMSEYASDLAFFSANCGKEKSSVHVFSGKNGVDWRVEKRR